MLSFVKEDIDIALGEQLIIIHDRELEKARNTHPLRQFLDMAKDFL